MTENTSCNICFSCPSQDDWDNNNILFNKICKTCNVVTCLYCTVKVKNVCPICKKKNNDLSVNGLYTFIIRNPTHYIEMNDLSDIFIKSITSCDQLLLSKICNLLTHFQDTTYDITKVYPYIQSCPNYSIIRSIIQSCIIEPEYDDFYFLKKAIENDDLECVHVLFDPEVIVPFSIYSTIIKLCKLDILKMLVPNKQLFSRSYLKIANECYKKSESDFEISQRVKIVQYLFHINNQ